MGRRGSRPDDPRVAEIVRQLLLADPTQDVLSAQATVLEWLGGRVQAATLAILNDPSLRERLKGPRSPGFEPAVVFQRARRMIGDQPPPGSDSAFAVFLESASEGLRCEAAEWLGGVAAPESLGTIRQLLNSPVSEIASRVVFGLYRAARAGRIERPTAGELFEDVRGVVDRSGRLGLSAELLLMLDRERATAFLTSEKVLTQGHPALENVLRTLDVNRVEVPRERLLTLIAGLGAEEPGEVRVGDVLREALPLLGRHRDLADGPLLQAYADGDDLEAARGACRGLLALCGLEDVERGIWTSGPAGLNPLQSSYRAVIVLDSAVCGEGFQGYFADSDAAERKEAFEGLRLLGFRERKALMSQALEWAGEAPPSESGEPTLDPSSPTPARDLSDLDTLWYASKEDVQVRTLRFVLAHAEDFR